MSNSSVFSRPFLGNNTMEFLRLIVVTIRGDRTFVPSVRGDSSECHGLGTGTEQRIAAGERISANPA